MFNIEVPTSHWAHWFTTTKSSSSILFRENHFHFLYLQVFDTASTRVKSYIGSVSQSVSLGVEPHLGLMTRYLAITIWQLRSCFLGRPLWREDGSVFCICCWVFPKQSFSSPSPLVFATYFTVSDLRLPISSPLTTRRVTVEVFDPKDKVNVTLRLTASQ
jgi:hypothetical protein